jgi:hypothetical protein
MSNPWNKDLCFLFLNLHIDSFIKGKIDEKELSKLLVKHTNDAQLNYDYDRNRWWFIIRPRAYLEGIKLLTQWFFDDKITEEELTAALDEYCRSHNPYRCLAAIKYGNPWYRPPVGRTIELIQKDFLCGDD